MLCETVIKKPIEKNNNIEVLRIIAMLMIIAGHAIGHGNIFDSFTPSGINYYLVEFFDVVFNVATNVYVAISGYLLCEKQFKINRAFGLWLQVFFYAVSIYLVLIFTNIIDFSAEGLIKALLPISGNQYWFARVYLGLYLFMPFLNLLIKAMSKKQYQYVLILSTILFSLWPSFIPFARTLNSEGGNSIIWFCVLYLFAAYIRKYEIKFKKIGYLIFGTVSFFVFSFISEILIGYISEKIGFGGRGTSIFTTFSSFPMLFGSMGILCIAINAPQINKFQKVIQYFSASAFSVYLIHDNKYIRDIIWNKLKISELANRCYILPYIIIVSVLIFVACAMIDKLSYSPIKKLVDKHTKEKQIANEK